MYAFEKIQYFGLGISVLIPPVFMAFLVATPRFPSQADGQFATLEVMKLIRPSERVLPYSISLNRRKHNTMHALLTGFYWLTFLFTFWGLTWGLFKIGLNPLSIAIFLMFISLVAFAGMKIRQRAKELSTKDYDTGLLWSIFEIFFLPVMQVGKWLSGKVTKYNLLIVIFNILIEAPFQLFIELLEQWRSFLKEKEEEIH